MSQITEMNKTIINSIAGVLFAVIGYFLVDFHNRSRAVEAENTQQSKDIAENRYEIVLATKTSQMKYDRFEEKMDDLKIAIVELTNELKSKK